MSNALLFGNFCPDFLQRDLHGECVVITLLGIFLQQLHHHFFQPDRAVDREARDARRLEFQVSKQHLRRVFLHKRRPPRQQFVHHTAECVEIGLARNRGLARNLFRGHVGICSDRAAGGGERRRLSIAGDAEIAELQPAIFRQEQICGLQITVNDAVVVGVLKRPGNLTANLDHLLPGELSLFLENPFQRAGIHQLHRIIVLRAVETSPKTAHNVLVTELLQDGHFPNEAFLQTLIGV